MPLLPPVSRPLRRHSRAIRAEVFERENGLRDMKARLTDHKPCDVADRCSTPRHLKVPHPAYRALVGLNAPSITFAAADCAALARVRPCVPRRGEGGPLGNTDEAGTAAARAISDYEVQSNS